MRQIIDIALDDPRWTDPLGEYKLLWQRAIKLALESHEIEADVELSLNFSNDDAIAELNAQYRDKKQPTNVLAFPVEDISVDEIVKISEKYIATQQPWMLGDVVLAYQTVEREAQEQGKEFSDHVTHLLVHAVLHLLGYDHMEQKETEEMEGLETQLLRQLSIGDPYA